MIEGLTFAVSGLAGALVARWWVLVLAVPGGLIAAGIFSFEGFSDTEVGVLFGIAVVIGLAVGVVVGKGLRKLGRER